MEKKPKISYVSYKYRLNFQKIVALRTSTKLECPRTFPFPSDNFTREPPKKSSTTGEPHQTFNWRETKKAYNPNLTFESKGSVEIKFQFSYKKEYLHMFKISFLIKSYFCHKRRFGFKN